MATRVTAKPGPAVAIDIIGDDNGKYRRQTAAAGAACATAASHARAACSTHGQPFAQALVALVRWCLTVQFYAARRLFRSCMRSMDHATLSTRLAAAEELRLELQERLANEQAERERLQAALKQADQLVAQHTARANHCEAHARAASADPIIEEVHPIIGQT